MGWVLLVADDKALHGENGQKLARTGKANAICITREILAAARAPNKPAPEISMYAKGTTIVGMFLGLPLYLSKRSIWSDKPSIIYHAPIFLAKTMLSGKYGRQACGKYSSSPGSGQALQELSQKAFNIQHQCLGFQKAQAVLRHEPSRRL